MTTVTLMVAECSGEADVNADTVVYQGAIDLDGETCDYSTPHAVPIRAGDVPQDELVFISRADAKMMRDNGSVGEIIATSTPEAPHRSPLHSAASREHPALSA